MNVCCREEVRSDEPSCLQRSVVRIFHTVVSMFRVMCLCGMSYRESSSFLCIDVAFSYGDRLLFQVLRNMSGMKPSIMFYCIVIEEEDYNDGVVV